jgi:ABC-type transport system involved in multi-copper enzyme maturation permease subunit
MNARLKKEFRALMLPWTVGTGASLLIGFFTLCKEGFFSSLHSDAWPFLIQCATFVACLSIPILAAMSFGTEYQQRTLSLLLAQPRERSRQWTEKFLALTVATLILALICPVSVLSAVVFAFGTTPIRHLTEPEFLQPALIVVVLIVTTVCSTAYWTMVARSIIGGIAFSAAAQFIVGVTVGFALYKIYGDTPLSDSIVTGAVVITGVVYSALFLWLGRRKFMRLELTDIAVGEGVASGSLLSWWPEMLRCRADSPLLNLVRKELRLQRTVFVIAGVLLGCWILTLLLSFVVPVRREYIEGVFGAIAAGYIFLLPVLAGSISLGEERTLGLTAWHLTLPVSARRQWLVKFIVSVVVAVVCGFLIPLLLINLTAAIGSVDAASFRPVPAQWPMILTAIGLPFLLSFWATSFLGNPVKAVVAAVVAVGVLGSACELGSWCADAVSPVLTLPVSAVVAWLQLPIFLNDRPGVFATLVGFSISVGVIAILIQSYIQFRRIVSRPWTFIRNAAILAVLTVCLSFWCADVVESLRFLTNSATGQISSALTTLPIKKSDFSGGKTKRITLQELYRNDEISWFMKTWLRKASITISYSEGSDIYNQRLYQRYGSGPAALQAQIMFPNGDGFGVSSEFFPSSRREN